MKNAQPKKLDLNKFKMFESKGKQEERKNDEQKNPIKIKKINANEFLQKMNNDRKTQNNQNSNKINICPNSNSFSNALNIFKQKEKDLKQKEINDKQEKEEKKRRALLTIENTRKKQLAQMFEKTAQLEEKAKKDLEEKLAKEKREQEWKKEMDKSRNGLFCEKELTSKDWRKEASKALKKMSQGKILELKEEQKVNICMDFSTRLANFFICGYEDKMVEYQFPNCLSYQRIENRFKFDFFSNEMNRCFPTEHNYLIEEGKIRDFDLMQLFVDYIISQKMNFDRFENCGILFTEPINFTDCEREKIIQIFFEDFYMEKIIFIKPSILTLLSEGKYTGIVAELDYDITNFIPINECISINNAIIKSELGQRDMFDYMKLLLDQDYPGKIKEKEIPYIVNNLCYTALNYDQEIYYVEKDSYALPDAREIYITQPRIKCPEILFNPSLYYKYKNSQTKGIVHNINESIKKCDIDIREELYNNIVLTGCNSKINKLGERLKIDLKNMVDYKYNDKVRICRNEKGISNGVEEFFKTPALQSLWYTRENHEEGIDFRKYFH